MTFPSRSFALSFIEPPPVHSKKSGMSSSHDCAKVDLLVGKCIPWLGMALDITKGIKSGNRGHDHDRMVSRAFYCGKSVSFHAFFFKYDRCQGTHKVENILFYGGQQSLGQE